MFIDEFLVSLVGAVISLRFVYRAVWVSFDRFFWAWYKQ